MAPKKIRCKADDCKEAVQRMFGDCGFCQRQFCAKHRLPEDHTCSGLDDCKKMAHEQNAAQLNQERTQTIKVA
ncbi:AN1-type zinc finger protein [Seiridium cupressi]|uniref:AN1-type domain-containing protein n=2 Tax=Seiridium TaxID=138063 RepID=A0ABR2VGT6_9PEZI